MINNRQGGRRRGRGGQGGGRNLGGQPGNRQDNRQRGNAAQLLEKYKSMARDAQLAGDRVQTEYYLQFADHYFRVLGESRARFEEQRPRASATRDATTDEGDEEMAEARRRRDAAERRRAASVNGALQARDRRRAAPNAAIAAERQRQRATPNRMNGGETMPFDVLPPAIGRDEAGRKRPPKKSRKRPRRRTRAPPARPKARTSSARGLSRDPRFSGG